MIIKLLLGKFLFDERFEIQEILYSNKKVSKKKSLKYLNLNLNFHETNYSN